MIILEIELLVEDPVKDVSDDKEEKGEDQG
jgi:hypothetical protein